MFLHEKYAVILLGFIKLINGQRWNITYIKESVKLPLLVKQQDAIKNIGDLMYEDMSSPPVIRNAISGGFINKSKNIPLSNGEAEKNEKNNLVFTTKSKPKRLIQRCALNNTRCKTRKQRKRTRFLEVFQIVQFEHVACTSDNGLEGTCLHEYECQSTGGTALGDCADGYGICCVNQFLCDEKSAASVGWFNNPDFPSPTSERLSCAFTLEKASANIKQLRIDFAAFELLPPTGGVCQQDQFVISGQNINNIMPILCGINTGQHVYVEVGDVDGPFYFAVQTVSSESRLFSIKITQLLETDELAAPSGCLQYFKGPQGYLESFNYRDKSDIGIARISSYLNNLNYAMCIDRESQACSIKYSNEDEMQIVNYDSDGLPIIPPDQAGVEIFNCPSDWLLIAATRICGYRLNDGSVIQDFTLNAPIIDSNAGPIVVWFRSDEGYVGRGFKLNYQQISCVNPTSI
ncbi:hypothetical protein O3G_MSEX006803 [Manduca sexta]|uniref:CUB domain-containing protein n=1 Tax=Manduca sexta TaxID=7130 RepID=A0A922CMH3_MANSE|nr:hypothetical protein O3G_MSEX006803 [Manduca sexta]